MSNALPAKDYVQSVVGSESPPGWPLEALKAQAVLTQTRLHQLTPNTFLSDTTQSESYQGLDVIRPAVREAVQAVWGQQLTYQGRPIQVYYHAACGGHTSPLGYIASYQQPSRPPVTPPYLRGVACQACRTSPFGQPKTVSIPKAAWTTRWGSAPISLSQLDPAGRPMTVTLGDGHTMSGYRFWILTGQRLGWDKLPGTRFTLLSSSDDTLSFQSVGSGHGVGLCQWGAASKARAGQTYRDILRAYFPGTHLTPR
jgi:stage II sporulation protein D